MYVEVHLEDLHRLDLHTKFLKIINFYGETGYVLLITQVYSTFY